MYALAYVVFEMQLKQWFKTKFLNIKVNILICYVVINFT